MIAELLDRYINRTPERRRAAIRFWYQLLSRLDTRAVMPFMNYGYVPPEAGPPLALDPADEPHRSCIQLYHHVAGAIDLRGRDVLEVGCGRGGGAAYIRRYLGPRSVIGVDFSDQAIRFCARQPGARFIPGDAEALPLAADSFDAVVNIESSHCYTSLERFATECARVLRPGGALLLADWRPAGGFGVLRAALHAAGFAILREDDITEGVVRALDRDNERKLALIRAHAPPLVAWRFARFAGVRGSPIYERLRRRELEYRSLVAQVC
jgi:SAM-dependent methyltransferase